MIVCYAQGGGLGHLTRIRAYLHTVHGDAPAVVVSSSPFAGDARLLGPHRAVAGPLPGVLASVPASLLVVDAFPAGVEGELRAADVPAGIRTVHLARLLRWDSYRRVVGSAGFDQTLVLEELSPDQLAGLSAISGAVARLDLVDPPAPACALPDVAGAWLIVHSGPPAEIDELVSYARECAALDGRRPRFVLVSPHRPASLAPDVRHVDVQPAWPLFAGAERVVSAAGFNVVRQMRPWRSKHLMLPFPRRWDDQFARAARARRK
ncbi:hypothetical protein [Actinoplanes siamensis]|uniref:Glycosyl transferase family 28 C-terminal domain-containing protein n=1 Tax=Actinoplanes siamensis TaxID=1223317 RepID=A0A919N6G3_9ACTN|nr:hypothetical protein [Actinoplanes siamensis]GIF05240.1 hypothetical protein Asi03nite_27780 [Actinoplanes siamensis]